MLKADQCGFGQFTVQHLVSGTLPAFWHLSGLCHGHGAQLQPLVRPTQWFHLSCSPHGRSDETQLLLTTGTPTESVLGRERGWCCPSAGCPPLLVSMLMTAPPRLQLLCHPQRGWCWHLWCWHLERKHVQNTIQSKNTHRRMRLSSFEPLPGPASPRGLCCILLCMLGGEELG